MVGVVVGEVVVVVVVVVVVDAMAGFLTMGFCVDLLLESKNFWYYSSDLLINHSNHSNIKSLFNFHKNSQIENLLFSAE